MGITITNNYNDIPIVYTGNSNDSVLQTGNDGITWFNKALAKAHYSQSPSFGKTMTREELLQSIDQKLEQNKKLMERQKLAGLKKSVLIGGP